MAAVVTSLGSLGPWVKNGEWTDTIEYLVTGVSSRKDAIDALNAAGKGYTGVHPVMVWLQGCDVTPIEDGATGYKLQTSYKKSDGITNEPNLLLRPPLVTYKYGMVQEPCDVDNAGNTIINTSGDPFNPPQTIEVPVIFMQSLKYFSSFNPTEALGYIGKVNSASCTIAGLGTVAARSVRCLNYAPANSFYLASTCIAVAAEFEYRPQLFDRKIFNKGFQCWYKDKSNNIKKGKLISKTTLQPIPEPVLLSSCGIPLYPDNVTVNDTNIDPATMWNHSHTNPVPSYITSNISLNYRLFQEADFSFFATKGF